MAEKVLYSDQTGPKLPGGTSNLNFRTVTTYTKDSSGKVISSKIDAYYAPGIFPTWTPGKNNTAEGFNPGGFALAATSTDGGITFTPAKFTQADVNRGIIPQSRIGESVLGETAIQSLTQPNGIINQAIKNSVTNTSVKAEPNLAGQLIKNNSATTNPNQQNNGGGGDAQSGNTPPADGSGDASGDTSGDTPPAIPAFDFTAANSQVTYKQGTRDIKKYPGINDLRYPINLKSEDQDTVRFKLIEYGGRTIISDAAKIATGEIFGGRDKITPSDGYVTLPIQAPISDSNSVNWSGESLSAIEGFAAGASLSLMKDGMNGLTNVASGLQKMIEDKNKDLGGLIAALTAEQATGAKGLYSRLTGNIVNPNLELLFGGPELRTFNFNFVMSARGPKEAANIRRIIRFFKQGMSVKRSDLALFLKSPFVFEIKYFLKTTENHPWLNRFKLCALTNCSVNYTPAGNYATYDDGAMTSYELSLQFSELEPVFDDEYPNSFDEIGY
jgi:hypothetical protein